jgi:F-type H+-transporting ATPase subunit b
LLVLTVLAFAEGGGNIINPDGSLVVVLILFFFFVLVLNRILFKPIGRILDEREALTTGAANEARASTGRYEATLAEYEDAMRAARAECFKMQEHSRADALEERRRIIEEAKGKAAEEIKRAKADVARQASEARTTLESESRRVAETISRTILGRTVGGAD